MMLPERTRRYNGPITEAQRWELFEHRPDDIFICTPPKCGTTWCQTIVAMLVFGRATINVEPSTISPWLDANFVPADAITAMLGAQTHRRFIKTHTPLDGIPFFPECAYLAVYRDPRDTYFSMVSHLKNMTDERVKAGIPAEVHSGFREWAQAPLIEGAAQQRSLAYVVHHFKSFWRYRDLPNLHIFHYSEFKRDLPRSIMSVGEAIGIPVDLHQANAMAETASFENMKANAGQFAPGASRGQWKVNESFFESGQSGRWHGILDHTDLRIYAARISEMLPANEVRWLEGGNP
jgi:aryl sulfotransferase